MNAPSQLSLGGITRAELTLPSHALSLLQPFAWAVVEGLKPIENRVWWTEIRGPIWIHASLSVPWAYFEEAKELIERLTGRAVPPRSELPYGAIVGRAEITDCILPGGYRTRERDNSSARGSHLFYGANWGHRHRPPLERHPEHSNPWHFVDQYGYVLRSAAKAREPVPCRGRQRWWKVPSPVLDRLGMVACDQPARRDG